MMFRRRRALYALVVALLIIVAAYSFMPRLAHVVGPRVASSADRTPATVCDSECVALLDYLSTNITSQKALIYVLTRADRISMLPVLVASLERYFRFSYPLLIIHEGHLTKEKLRALEALTSKPVFHQVITLPPMVSLTNRSMCPSAPGYREMCRFQAKTVYEMDIMKGVNYYWRLDDDSVLTAPVTYDIFHYMSTKHYLYGYIWPHVDSLPCTEGLWEAAHAYVYSKNITTEFLARWLRPRIFYNNFEVSAMSVWTNGFYSSFVDYIDGLGGIQNHRWGDAPIKSIAVAISVPLNRMHWFGDIGYRHGSYENKPTYVQKPLI